jgi:prefoldin beta subunit
MASKAVVDEEYAKFQNLQKEVQALYVTKQQTLSQYNENTLVKEELDLLEDSKAVVYKLIGPALMNVELEDARANVNKRLEFIEGEIIKIDNQITTKQAEQTAIGERVSKMQSKMQEEAAKAAREIYEQAN